MQHKTLNKSILKHPLTKALAMLQSQHSKISTVDMVNHVLDTKDLLKYLIRIRHSSIKRLIRQLGLPFTPEEIRAEAKNPLSYIKHLLEIEIIYVLILEYIYEMRQLQYLQEGARREFEMAQPHKHPSYYNAPPTPTIPHVETETREKYEEISRLFIAFTSILSTDLIALELAKNSVLEQLQSYIFYSAKQDRLLSRFVLKADTSLRELFVTEEEFELAVAELAGDYTNIHDDIREARPTLAKLLIESKEMAAELIPEEHTLNKGEVAKPINKNIPKPDPAAVNDLLAKLALSQDLHAQIRLIPLLKKLGIKEQSMLINELNGSLGKMLLKYGGLNMKKQFAEHKIQQEYAKYCIINENCKPIYAKHHKLANELQILSMHAPLENGMRLHAQNAYRELQLPKEALDSIKHLRPKPLRTRMVMNPFGKQ